MSKELTPEQKKLLKDLAVKTAKQEGVQQVRKWTDVGDSPRFKRCNDDGPLYEDEDGSPL